jgi:hypothetical protein
MQLVVPRNRDSWLHIPKVNPVSFIQAKGHQAFINPLGGFVLSDDDSFPERNLYIDRRRPGCMFRRRCMPKRKMFCRYRKSGKHFER